MAEGLTNELLLAALVCGVACALISCRELPLVVSLPLVAVRLALPVIYFGWYFDGTWTGWDDTTYFAQGAHLLDLGYTPVSILMDPDGREQLFVLAGGHHVLYIWWNALAQWMFGYHYYAPVMLNVVVCFVTALLFVRTLGILSFPAAYCRAFFVFFVLHWEVLAWSSIVNVKDILVQGLTAASLYCLVLLFHRQKLVYLVSLVVLAQLFYWLRFYVPLLMLAAVALWVLSQWRDPRALIALPVAAACAYVATPWNSSMQEYIAPSLLAYGAVRFAATPLPWKLNEAFSFLLLPALLNLVFLVPACFGAVRLWRYSRLGRLIIIYLLCVVAFYSVTENLQGARQRCQVVFILAWLQFHVLWEFRRRASSEPPTVGQNAVGRPPAARIRDRRVPALVEL